MNRYPLLGLLLVLAGAPAFARSPDEAQKPGDSLETFVVTGTRTASRTVPSSPIDVITPQALEATGTTELARVADRAAEGQLPYSVRSPNGFNGAHVYASIAYKW